MIKEGLSYDFRLVRQNGKTTTLKQGTGSNFIGELGTYNVILKGVPISFTPYTKSLLHFYTKSLLHFYTKSLFMCCAHDFWLRSA